MHGRWRLFVIGKTGHKREVMFADRDGSIPKYKALD